jgi:hypothetical protein
MNPPGTALSALQDDCREIGPRCEADRAFP